MSKRLYAAAAAALLIFTVRVHAGYSRTQDFRLPTAEEKAMKSVDFAPGAPAAILEWVRVDDDTNSFSAEYVRMKIFSEDGKKFADIEVPYSPGYPYYGRVDGIDARTIHPDGTIVPFKGKVYDKMLYKAGRSAVKAKTFSIPDVQPGDVVEYRFTRRWSEQMLLPTNWNVQFEIPMLKAKLILRPYDSGGEYASFFTYIGLPAGKVPTRMTDRFELELENIAPYVEESYAPPEYMLRSHVNFYYTYSRLSPAEFWEAEPKKISKRVEDFLGRAGDAKAIAAKLAGADPKTTAKNIYAHVQGFRNYSYELEKTEQEMKKESITAAKNVADVLKKSAGYDEELNRAFVALARAAGLQADVVRVSSRDAFFFSNKIADADQLNDEVAIVMIDGQPLLLDPGVPHAPFGTLSWEKTNVPGVRVTKGQPAQWVMTPQGKPEDAVIHRSADLKIDGENLTGKVVVTWTGQEALVRRLRTLTDAEAERTKTYEDSAKRWFAAGATVKLAKLDGATTFDGPLVATFDVTLPNMVSAAGSRTVVPLSVFAANAANPFAPTTRKHAIYFEYPRSAQDEVKLTIPDDLEISAVPKPVKMNAGTFGYTNEAKAEGQSVSYKRSTFVNVMLVEAKNYGPLRNFYSSMLTADQEPIVLVAKE